MMETIFLYGVNLYYSKGIKAKLKLFEKESRDFFAFQ